MKSMKLSRCNLKQDSVCHLNKVKMKCILLISYYIVLCSTQLCGQNKPVNFFLDEITISFNYTSLTDVNTINGKGFGIGLYHNLEATKKIKAIVGFEYNQTNQLKNQIYGGNYIHYTNLNYKIHNATIPLSLRYFMVKSIFIDAGLFADLLIGAKTQGTKHRNLPSEPEIIEEFSDNNTDLHSINYGFQVGLGVRIPINKFKLILNSDYRYGLRVLSSGLDELHNRYWNFSIGLSR